LIHLINLRLICRSIYKMLCQKRKVLSISPLRKQEVIKALEEKVDADALAYSKSASFIIGLLLGLVRKAIFGVSYEVGMHQINKSFIDKEKTRYKEEENRVLFRQKFNWSRLPLSLSISSLR